MDKERVKNKLDEIERYVRELEEGFSTTEEDYLENLMQRRGCERTFQLACESLIDVCNLIIAGRGFEVPKDSKDSVAILEKHKIISEDISARIQNMIGFRNLLVHRYAKVDDPKVYHYLKGELDDFYKFIQAIENSLKNI
jgi:uncharacterized protein YutE (UPF0331/DUF86 family)